MLNSAGHRPSRTEFGHPCFRAFDFTTIDCYSDKTGNHELNQLLYSIDSYSFDKYIYSGVRGIK